MRMRKIHRPPLEKRLRKYLAKKQLEVRRGREVAVVWLGARKTKAMRDVEATLRSMAGTRERCMFCEDSRGVDIEHFRPKSTYQTRAFHWRNLLIACTGCNRLKGDRFSLDASGQPLLIDPTSEDPWDSLFYDSHTGLITARIDPATGIPNPKGSHTSSQQVLPLNFEAVTRGRRSTHRNLRRAVAAFVASVSGHGPSHAAQAELLETVTDNSLYGLADWCFRREGSDEYEFHVLKTSHPSVWSDVVSSLP